jgi:hypothetical protein
VYYVSVGLEDGKINVASKINGETGVFWVTEVTDAAFLNMNNNPVPDNNNNQKIMSKMIL